MKRHVTFIICLLFVSVIKADWVVEKGVDAMTDALKKSAVVRNKKGHSFSIYRISKNGEVWGNFALSDSMFDQVDWKNPPMFRVDKHKPVDLSDQKKLQELGVGVHAYEWEPKWVNFLMWHGKQEEGLSPLIVNIMEGKEIAFRYYLSTLTINHIS